MKYQEFDAHRYGVKAANWLDVFLFLITRGRKGRAFEVVSLKYTPPTHINCRCVWRENE